MVRNFHPLAYYFMHMGKMALYLSTLTSRFFEFLWLYLVRVNCHKRQILVKLTYWLFDMFFFPDLLPRNFSDLCHGVLFLLGPFFCSLLALSVWGEKVIWILLVEWHVPLVLSSVWQPITRKLWMDKFPSQPITGHQFTEADACYNKNTFISAVQLWILEGEL